MYVDCLITLFNSSEIREMIDRSNTFESQKKFLGLYELKKGTEVMIKDKRMMVFIGKGKHVVYVEIFTPHASFYEQTTV